MNMQEQDRDQDRRKGRAPAQADMPEPGLLAVGSPMREVLIRGTRLRKTADELLDSAEPSEEDESKVVVSRSAVEELRQAVELWAEPVE